jgi:hypothetical protein
MLQSFFMTPIYSIQQFSVLFQKKALKSKVAKKQKSAKAWKTRMEQTQQKGTNDKRFATTI